MSVYIAYRRYKGKDLFGRSVNIPYGTEMRLEDKCIATKDGRGICLITSEVSHEYFARNDDGRGIERGGLIRRIMDKLSRTGWEKVCRDPFCARFRRTEIKDRWLWGQAFHDAEVSDLRYIDKLLEENKNG